MKIVFIGLSITSSWGNGHATTYRALIRELAQRGHEILFFERDVPWYASHRDYVPDESEVQVVLYDSLEELYTHEATVRSADAVIVGSYVPQGIAVSEWVFETASGVTAFYDIDTPVTFAQLDRGECEYLNPSLIERYHLYLSFAGGRSLTRLEDEFGSPCARAFHCSVDPERYRPEPRSERWDLGYLGTYSEDRQPTLTRLLLEPAVEWEERRFIVAGPQYPKDIVWPSNVERVEHLPPDEHRAFYNSQRFTLNVTRKDMISAGHSPSVRLFEAAACGTAIISDWWEGIEDYFTIGKEILIAINAEDVMRLLRDCSKEEAARVGAASRQRVLAEHTAAHRASELENYLRDRTQPFYSQSA